MRVHVQRDRLLSEARLVRERAYAPYSRFRVGAALQGKSGRIYTGCNVENASYGATICAERAALARAVSDGEREFAALAVASGGPGPVPPCGICRQTLVEFCEDLPVFLTGGDGAVVATSLQALSPGPFSRRSLGGAALGG